jgi:hypothetical protein
MAAEAMDDYLYESYQRTVKVDSYAERTRVAKRRWQTVYKEEDYAWKDPAAAKHANMPLKDYLLAKVAEDFKTRFYWLSRTIEALGVPVGIKSAFRDDFRQGLILHGIRARVGYSRHGGSAHGGVGMAIDVAVRSQSRSVQTARNGQLLALIDRFGRAFGIRRPIPNDPNHIEPVSHPASAVVVAKAAHPHRHARHHRHTKVAAQEPLHVATIAYE